MGRVHKWVLTSDRQAFAMRSEWRRSTWATTTVLGTVAPGLFAQEGRCWRMVYENPVGQGRHCMEPVKWVGGGGS